MQNGIGKAAAGQQKAVKWVITAGHLSHRLDGQLVQRAEHLRVVRAPARQKQHRVLCLAVLAV